MPGILKVILKAGTTCRSWVNAGNVPINRRHLLNPRKPSLCRRYRFNRRRLDRRAGRGVVEKGEGIVAVSDCAFERDIHLALEARCRGRAHECVRRRQLHVIASIYRRPDEAR
jgi:hypothetical protein